VFAPGHVGELTQQVDGALVDAVLEETGAVERRLRLLPSRVVVYFVLALALFGDCSYQDVWENMTAELGQLGLAVPAASSLARARRRVGTALLRLLTLAECGTRALLAAAFGPDSDGELHYARQLLAALDDTMLLLADAGFDDATFLASVARENRAQFLVRSSAARVPTPLEHLPDGSYRALIGYGVLKELLPVRVIEAEVTITLEDGTVTTSQWRLLTTLLDCDRYPASQPPTNSRTPYFTAATTPSSCPTPAAAAISARRTLTRSQASS
jgi:hypothetical protein